MSAPGPTSSAASYRFESSVFLLQVLLLLAVMPLGTSSTDVGVASAESAKSAAAGIVCDGGQVEQPPHALRAAAPGNAKHKPGQPIGSSLVFICAKGFEGWKGMSRLLYLKVLGRRIR